jgi:hypothetical protein
VPHLGDDFDHTPTLQGGVASIRNGLFSEREMGVPDRFIAAVSGRSAQPTFEATSRHAVGCDFLDFPIKVISLLRIVLIRKQLILRFSRSSF